ncbi:unnamed product [Ostreococcus tauri]|uniref:Unnamed product n=1 Tax=Ostreococcus tauri TaxID=70448 RepID=Q011G1_OSTTA|nr:unnamed product [Ostreococcus tauri]CAL55469.1 unnamed product [Ostreococcus tauri]|eukprot:XP_003081300.1 unnamed product [Ostreococcus tauri]
MRASPVASTPCRFLSHGARPSTRASASRDDGVAAEARDGVFRASGYRTFYDDVESEDATTVKVDCGPVSAYLGGTYDGEKVAWRSSGTTPAGERDARATRRTYAFDRVLAHGASTIVSVTEERPLGIIFEPDADGRVRVADFVVGSRAARANDAAALAPFGADCCRRGDVLRAFTATQVAFKSTAALTGDLSGTKRVRTLFGADGRTWGEVQAALANGRKADGPITLVLERDSDRARAEAWPRPPEEIEFRGLGEETTTAKRARERLESDDEETTRANIAFASAAVAFIGLILAGFS